MDDQKSWGDCQRQKDEVGEEVKKYKTSNKYFYSYWGLRWQSKTMAICEFLCLNL